MRPDGKRTSGFVFTLRRHECAPHRNIRRPVLSGRRSSVTIASCDTASVTERSTTGVPVISHTHVSAAAANRDRLLAVLGLSLFVLLVEVVGGIASNSLALLADAGHMLTDVSGIGLSLLAIWFAGRRPTTERSFGYLRLEIFAAVANAVLLFGVAAFILVEAWQRLSAPPEVASGLMLGVALVGLAVNAVSLFVLRDAQRTSLNMRGAYLEVMGDLAGSAAVIVAAVIITWTGWIAADAARIGGHRPLDPAADLTLSSATRPTSCSRRRRRTSI